MQQHLYYFPVTDDSKLNFDKQDNSPQNYGYLSDSGKINFHLSDSVVTEFATGYYMLQIWLYCLFCNHHECLLRKCRLFPLLSSFSSYNTVARRLSISKTANRLLPLFYQIDFRAIVHISHMPLLYTILTLANHWYFGTQSKYYIVNLYRNHFYHWPHYTSFVPENNSKVHH